MRSSDCSVRKPTTIRIEGVCEAREALVQEILRLLAGVSEPQKKGGAA